MIDTSIFQYVPDTNTLKLQNSSANDGEIKNALATVPKEIIESIHEVDLSNAYLMQELPSELNRFKNVKILKIESCHALKSLDGVQNLNISHLFASRCKKIENIEALKGRNIQVLDLSYNLGLNDLSGLQSLTETLEKLFLEGVPRLQTTRRLVGLRNLRELNIKDTGITDTSSISFIPKIVV